MHWAVMTHISEDVECPVCEGTAISLVSGRTCTRCDGTGKIEKELAERLERIRRDLTQRLLDRGLLD